MSILQDIRLSVVLAVFNEEQNLGECLESVKEIAQELVVVDGGSTDSTVAIAERYGATVIKTDNPAIFHINKQKALDAAHSAWILQLDADERVTKELAAEISKVVRMSDIDLRGYRVQDEQKQKLFARHEELIRLRDGQVGNPHKEVAAFFIPRSNYFLGKFLKYGGTYPDGVIRLVRNGSARFALKDVHDQMQIDGSVRWLEHDLIHMADPSFARYLVRSNRYTTLQAEQWLAERSKLPHKGTLQTPQDPNNSQTYKSPPATTFPSIIRWMVWEPKMVFLKIYFRNKGLMDGFPGFVWALYSALHIASSYVKFWEKAKNNL